MNKGLLLCKSQILGLFGINKLLHSKEKGARWKLFGLVLGGAFLVAALLGTSFMYSLLMAMGLEAAGAMEVLPAVMLAASCLLILMFSAYQTNGVLFGYRDYDMVLSLPVKTSTIVASRLWMIYLSNAGFNLLILLPCGVVFALQTGMTAPMVVLYVLLTLLVPLVPIILGTFLGSIITLLAARFRHGNLVTILLSCLLLVGVMAGSFNTQEIVEHFAVIGQALMAVLNRIYPLCALFVGAITGNLWMALGFAGLSLGLFVLFVAVMQRFYRQINSLLMAKRAKGNFKLTALKGQSPVKALYLRELKRYVSSSIYVINTGFGMVLLPLAAFYLLFAGREQLAVLLELPGLSESLADIAPLGISLFVAMSCTSACSVSMEGKSLWVAKALPISEMNIFWSKLLVNLTVTVPITLLCAPAVCFALGANGVQCVLMVLTPLAYALFIAIAGLLLDLRMPNFAWSSEAVAVKQSMPAMFTVLGGMAITAGPAALVLSLGQSNTLLLTAAVTATVALCALLGYILLKTWGVKAFRRF